MRTQKDTSSLQVTDFASLIWNTNQAIMESLVYGNNAAVPSLVEYLETLLTPYIDTKYEKHIEEINKYKPKEGKCIAEIKTNQSIFESKRVTETHRALINLAHRKGFLPASRGGQSVDFDMRGYNE